MQLACYSVEVFQFHRALREHEDNLLDNVLAEEQTSSRWLTEVGRITPRLRPDVLRERALERLTRRELEELFISETRFKVFLMRLIPSQWSAQRRGFVLFLYDSNRKYVRE